ncbi:MAG TPA: DUF4260 family protein, partial [Bacillota bacterium]|nr:DUF4260 family protein [Bacillota bacterium]
LSIEEDIVERMLYRIENGLILIISFYVFLVYETTWTKFLFFLVFPKLIYLIPSHWCWNQSLIMIRRNLIAILHSYSTVVIIAAVFFLFFNMVMWSILGWVIHIAMDRVIKYKEKTLPHPLFQARGSSMGGEGNS